MIPQWGRVAVSEGGSEGGEGERADGKGVGIRLRVVYGDQTAVLQLSGCSTAYVERTHLTSRRFNSRVFRKAL